jgi:hypothetical protein
MQALTEECNASAQKEAITPPFASYTSGALMWRLRKLWQTISPNPKSVVRNPLPSYTLGNPSEFLIFYNQYREQFVPAPEIKMRHITPGQETVHQKEHKYRLVGGVQVLFTFGEKGPSKEFHTGYHSVCCARYKNQWFICSDETITPVNPDKLYQYVDYDARITYEGAHQAMNHNFPLIVLYERVNDKCESDQDNPV